MKAPLLLLAGLGLSLTANAQTRTMVWHDEFNAPTLDQTKWSYETGTGVDGNFGTGQLDRATDRPENVAIEQGIAGADGGALRITTRKERYQDRNYTSGRINTKDKGTWGPGHRIVARVWPKGVRTQGQGFAFWMLGSEAPAGVPSLTWPQVGEIDIMEYVGSIPANNLGTVHYAWEYNKNEYADWNHGFHGAYYSFADKQVPDPTEFIRVDLGAIYSVNRVNLNWENNGKTYTIETSVDGTTWQPAYSTTSGPVKGVADATFDATNARFVRVNGTLRDNEYGYSLYELQVFAAGNTTNLALNRPATSSSVENASLGPALAVDGNATTRWSSGFGKIAYQCCAPASDTDPNIGANGWHEYGIDWFADRMEFFVDGNVYHIHYFNDGAAFGKVDKKNEESLVLVNDKKVKKSEYSNLYPEWHPFEHKMYAILSAGVGGSNNTYGGPIASEAMFPADVYIDWVRVYSNQAVTAAAPAQQATQVVGYPNPVESSFQLTNVAQGAAVKIVDVAGRVVLQTTVRNSAVDISTLRAGTYVVLIQDKKTVQRLKILKK